MPSRLQPLGEVEPQVGALLLAACGHEGGPDLRMLPTS
jgi:hypothetical protein